MSDIKYLLISGCPRSGTSILRTVLNMHPNIFIVNEMRMFGTQPLQIVPSNFKDMKDDINKIRELNNKLQSKRSGNPQVIFNAIKPHYSEHEIVRYFGDKFPAMDFSIMAKNHPKVQIIYCLRDGRNVILSQLRAGITKNWWGANNIQQAMGLWINETQRWCQWRPKFENRIEVMYENLMTNGKEHLKWILDKIGLPVYGDLLDKMAWQYREQHLPWQKAMPNINQKLTPMFKKMLRKMGYEC